MLTSLKFCECTSTCMEVNGYLVPGLTSTPTTSRGRQFAASFVMAIAKIPGIHLPRRQPLRNGTYVLPNRRVQVGDNYPAGHLSFSTQVQLAVTHAWVETSSELLAFHTKIFDMAHSGEMRQACFTSHAKPSRMPCTLTGELSFESPQSGNYALCFTGVLRQEMCYRDVSSSAKSEQEAVRD